MNDNLPPGVSSNDYDISGADEDYHRMWCDTCDKQTWQTILSHPEIIRTACCEMCDTTVELGDDDV